MKNNKTYYSISEVAKMLNIKEHTIRFWDSKLPGLSKQSEKGKTRFFNQNQIQKISSLNQLLQNNDSLDLAYKVLSKERINRDKVNLETSHQEKKINSSDSLKNIQKTHKIEQIINNLKTLS